MDVPDPPSLNPPSLDPQMDSKASLIAVLFLSCRGEGGGEVEGGGKGGKGGEGEGGGREE